VKIGEWKGALMKIILLLFVFTTSGYLRLLAVYKSLSGSRDRRKLTAINISRTLDFKGLQ
jgi:hypothetical protein